MGALARGIRAAGLLLCWAGAASAQLAGYEAPPRLDARVLLGESTIRGEHFAIEREVVNDGLMNRLVVVSGFQRIEALGNSLALERAREQEAIAALREIQKTDAFRDGIEKAIEAPLAVSRQALRDPRGTLADLPRGVANLWRDVASGVASVGRGSAQPLDLEVVLKDLAGYTRTKRRLAAKLGVDPFSSNRVLQRDLEEVSWAVFAGGASVELALTQAPTAASLSLAALRLWQRARSSLWGIPIPTLQHASVEALEGIGLAPEEADSLVYSASCTVTQQTLLVGALADLRDVSGRDGFARMAADAHDENTCRLHMETAGLLWAYHHASRPLETVEIAGPVVHARDVDGREILVLRADYVAWTPHTAELVAGLPRAEQRVLWLSGALSPRSRRELQRRGLTVEERVFDRFPRQIHVAAILTPERADRVPEDDAANQVRPLVEDFREGARNLMDGHRP